MLISLLVPLLYQECYDDAMNAADEHGVIYSEKCREPFECRSSNRNLRDHDAEPVAPRAPADTQLNPEGRGEGLAEWEGSTNDGVDRASSSRGGAPAPLVLVEELCEVARPEIAAGAIVASACKVKGRPLGALHQTRQEHAADLRTHDRASCPLYVSVFLAEERGYYQWNALACDSIP